LSNLQQPAAFLRALSVFLNKRTARPPRRFAPPLLDEEGTKPAMRILLLAITLARA